MYLYCRDRAYLYIYNRRACKEHYSQQPQHINDSRQILFGVARSDGYASGRNTGHSHIRFFFAAACKDIQCRQHDESVNGNLQRLRRRMAERIFCVEYRRYFTLRQRNSRRIQYGAVRHMADIAEMQRYGES